MIRFGRWLLAVLVLSAPQSLAPYNATPEDVVDRMLTLAGVGKNDLVYDLGCGDGRIPIAAAKTYGAHGVGVDTDPRRIAESKANARTAGVEHLVEFRLEDVLKTDVSRATVVTLFLLPSSNVALRPMLRRQLKPGARIVSHAFRMGPDWPADQVDHFVSARGDEVTLYLWKIRDRGQPPVGATTGVRPQSRGGLGSDPGRSVTHPFHVVPPTPRIGRSRDR